MINRETAGKAVEALLKWMRARAEQRQKAELLDPDDDLLYIVLTLKLIPPKSRIKPYHIPLPYPLHDLASTAAATLDRTRSLSLPFADAIPLPALAADYRSFEARRLCIGCEDDHGHKDCGAEESYDGMT